MTGNGKTDYVIRGKANASSSLSGRMSQATRLIGQTDNSMSMSGTTNQTSNLSGQADVSMSMMGRTSKSSSMSGGISGGGGLAPIHSSVTLLASAWVGDDSPYSQVVTIDKVTKNSKVDLQLSVEQLAIFHDKDLAFLTENDDGVITVYAIGDKPTRDYTIQVTITEVAV